MQNFDLKSFHHVLDQRRRQRGLTWSELAAEVNRPFAGLSSIPISVGTIRGIATKSSVTSAVVLQLLRWMGDAPESFLQTSPREPLIHERLPHAESNQILRFDTRALYDALDKARMEHRLTWQEVAGELPGFTSSMLTNLKSAPLIGFPRVMLLTQWLGSPAADFVRACAR